MTVHEPVTDAAAASPARIVDRSRSSTSRRHVIMWLVGLYAVALALIAFWPVPVDRGAGAFLAAITRMVPWATYDVIEFTANVALFVPLGVLGALLLRRRIWLVVPLAFLATATIEVGQAVLLDARTSSIMDVVANMLGAVIGVLIVVLVTRWRGSADA